MNNIYSQIEAELMALKNPKRAADLQWFFKTGPGEYGEGDVFLGIKVPYIRAIISKYWKQIDFECLDLLLKNKAHEFRSLACMTMDQMARRATNESQREVLAKFYLDHLDCINNWDLVDVSAPRVIGGWLKNKSDRLVLYELADRDHLWSQRVAMISCMMLIDNNDFIDAMKLAKILLHHPHDLMHKAVGWALREIGKRDITVLDGFLEQYYKEMPRTMLRYAIEKHKESKRQAYLKGLV